MNDDTANTITGAAGAATGFGVLTMGLFPFALPGLLITLPLVLPLVLLALPLIPLVAIGLAIRALMRRSRAKRVEAASAERPARRPRPSPARG
jgi:hypothetical protein